MARIVKIKSAMAEFNMIKLFKGLLYSMSEKRFVCPRCRAAFRKTGRPEEGVLFERAVRGAILFTKERRPSVVACRCGYRAIEKKADKPYIKMCERCGVNELPIGRKAFCFDCVPAKRPEPKNPIAAAHEGMTQACEALNAQVGLGI